MSIRFCCCNVTDKNNEAVSKKRLLRQPQLFCVKIYLFADFKMIIDIHCYPEYFAQSTRCMSLLSLKAL